MIEVLVVVDAIAWGCDLAAAVVLAGRMGTDQPRTKGDRVILLLAFPPCLLILAVSWHHISASCLAFDLCSMDLREACFLGAQVGTILAQRSDVEVGGVCLTASTKLRILHPFL